jgi:hypothetical protein
MKEKPQVTRGLVLGLEHWITDWTERARTYGLTTLALHAPPSRVVDFMGSEVGEKLIAGCKANDIQLEFELHAMGELLPRCLFETCPELFRLDETGQRTARGNLCATNEEAVALVCANAVKLARRLRPTTHRFFFWPDDGPGWCHCEQCGTLSDSDQALLVENAILRALRDQVDPQAQLAHIAYHNTLQAPQQITPEEGVFLEFAPFHRKTDLPLTADVSVQREQLEALQANLAVFGVSQAQVLDYWLDVSMYSRWKRPAVVLPWREDVLLADLELYASLGVRHVTSFAVYVDTEYLAMYGEPPLSTYGCHLQRYVSG